PPLPPSPPLSTLFPYTTLFRSFIPYLGSPFLGEMTVYLRTIVDPSQLMSAVRLKVRDMDSNLPIYAMRTSEVQINNSLSTERMIDRKSTRLNSSHQIISYAVFC